MWIFCRHNSLTTPREDEEGSYQRCLECGARLEWEWPEATGAHKKAASLFLSLFLKLFKPVPLTEAEKKFY